MNQLNSLILEGNIAKDSELMEPAEGFKVFKFPIGVNRWYKNKDNQGVEEVSFFDIEAYGKLAEYCNKKATKGRGVRVVGRLKQDKWTGEDGKMQSKIFVVAEHIEFRPDFSKKAEENLSENSNSEQPDSEEIAYEKAAAQHEKQKALVEEVF